MRMKKVLMFRGLLFASASQIRKSHQLKMGGEKQQKKQLCEKTKFRKDHLGLVESNFVYHNEQCMLPQL